MAALPFALLIQRKLLAVLFSVLTSTLLLKVWAYIVLGGFDFVFLLLLIVGDARQDRDRLAARALFPLISEFQYWIISTQFVQAWLGLMKAGRAGLFDDDVRAADQGGIKVPF